MLNPLKPSPLAIILLGRFQLRADGKSLATIPRKARALLAYLAMQDDRPVSREAMADLLWSDRGAEQARHSLRQMLLVLRRDLRAAGLDVIDVGERTISLRPAQLVSDVRHMRALAQTGDRASLTEAAELYGGPFLAEFPTVSPDFDDWVTRIRDQEAAAALDILNRLADRCSADADMPGAVLAMERLVALDPLREDSHRRLMTAYAAAGRRVDAVRQYNACVEILRRELDVVPDAATVELARRIREGSLIEPEPMRETVFARPLDGPPWVAVLPFRALGPDAVPDYFAAGLVEDIVAMLAMWREPVVVSSGSTLAYQGRAVDPREIGQALSVRYIVTGSIYKIGQRLRYFVELAEAATRRILWARHYDTDAETPHMAHDIIAAQIVTSLIPRIYDTELERIKSKPPHEYSAYDQLLRARGLLVKLDRLSFDRAGEHIAAAVTADPDYAAAPAAMAEWLSLRIGQGWSSNPGNDAADLNRFTQLALERDANNTRALSLLGHNRTVLYRDYDAALALFQQAESVAPNDASLWLWSSVTHTYLGDTGEAVRRADRALRLSPRDRFLFRTYHVLSMAHYTAGSYEEAIHWGQLSTVENARYTANLRVTAAAMAALGRLDEARSIAGIAVEQQPEFDVLKVAERHPYAEMKRRRLYAEHLRQAGLPVLA